jgi:hypothetical protein
LGSAISLIKIFPTFFGTEEILFEKIGRTQLFLKLVVFSVGISVAMMVRFEMMRSVSGRAG